MPSAVAASRAFARSRDAIAVNSSVLALLHRGKDFLEADVGGAENSPAKFVGHDEYDTGTTQKV
jgi:hypothetical protein